MADYILGGRSLAELEGVHADLVAVVQRGIALTVQDFSVHEGLRSLQEQRQLFARGATRTLDSRHLSGHAVDLVPWINGRLRWEWPPIFAIAEAVRLAAGECGVPLRWGGAWDRLLTESDEPVPDLVADYVARRRRAHKEAFIDGPHFELPRSAYP